MTRAARYGYRKVGDATPWKDFRKPDGDAKKFFNEREQSRAERRINRKKGMICFNCRQTGHTVANCPKDKEAAGICYKCGESDHTTKSCKKQTDPEEGDFPFATCFLCKEKGHLTRSCPQNDHGLYPNGGCCRFCGKTDHLKMDCPDMRKKRQANENSDGVIGVWDNSGSVDTVEVQPTNTNEAAAPSKAGAKKKKKIVTF